MPPSRLVFDIETDGLLPECTVLHSIVIADLDTGERVMSVGSPDRAKFVDAVRLLNSADEVWGHNILDFDIRALRKLGYPVSPKKVRDTLVCSRLIWADLNETDHGRPNLPGRLIGSHSLEAWGYRLGSYKSHHTDWSKWTEEMQRYCEQDVAVNVKLARLICDQNWAESSLDLEHRFATIVYEMTGYGITFDQAAAAELTARLSAEREQIVPRLHETFPPRVIEMKTPAYWEGDDGSRWRSQKDAKDNGYKGRLVRGPNKTRAIPFNPGSRVQAAERLIEAGWQPEAFTATGRPKLDDDTLEHLDVAGAGDLVRYLLISKRLGQISEGNEAWLRAAVDGRIYHYVNTCGTVTGRCSHSRPNLAQVPRVGSPFGTECRALFRAAPGRRMVGADASGLELRCLAHYLHPFDGGAYTQALLTGDIHTHNQSAFGLAPGKEGRNRSKTAIYCLIYGGGDWKLGLSLGELLPEFEEQVAHVRVPGWAMKSLDRVGGATERNCLLWKRGKFARDRVATEIAGFGELADAVKRAAETRGYLRGVDGRRLRIRKKHAALNTLLQSAGAVAMKQAGVTLCDLMTEKGLPHGSRWNLLLTVHDEYQSEADPEVAEDLARTKVQAIEEAGRLLKFNCPLTGESRIGDNWAETH